MKGYWYICIFRQRQFQALTALKLEIIYTQGWQSHMAIKVYFSGVESTDNNCYNLLYVWNVALEFTCIVFLCTCGKYYLSSTGSTLLYILHRQCYVYHKLEIHTISAEWPLYVWKFLPVSTLHSLAVLSNEPVTILSLKQKTC